MSAELAVEIIAPSRLAVQIAISDPAAHAAQEDIAVLLDDAPIAYEQVAAPTGGRAWVIDAPVGKLELNYRAVLNDTPPLAPARLDEQLIYLRPSRYCESDRMIGMASRLFRGIDEPGDVLAAVSSWVGTQLEYVAGSSGPTDGAVDTLLAGRGVCRDYAHLAICLLRALGTPARLAAVYAPGLHPMDFHAVAEALIDDVWYVVDGTLLAPRASLARITTGRDAADTSFLSSYGGQITMTHLEVTATVEGDLPTEDVKALVSLR